MIDLALVHDNATGEVMLHTANCPVARRMAEEGHPVMTMLGCEVATLRDGAALDAIKYKRHSCITITEATASE